MKRPCRICWSEYRNQIEGLLDDGWPYRAIARDYVGRFDCGLHLLEQSLAVHNRHKEVLGSRLIVDGIIRILWERLEKAAKSKKGTSVEFVADILANIKFQEMNLKPGPVTYRDFDRLSDILTAFSELKQGTYGYKSIPT